MKSQSIGGLRYWVLTILTVSALSSGCDRCRTQALERLTEQGHTQVELTTLVKQGCHYQYRSEMGPDNCEGHIKIRFVGSLAQFDGWNRCTKAANRTTPVKTKTP